MANAHNEPSTYLHRWHGCVYLVGGYRRLLKFMDAVTENSWRVEHSRLTPEEAEDENVPF